MNAAWLLLGCANHSLITRKQYGTVMWGLNKLYLLMEKQHNRGQDGAGIGVVKLNVEPGYPFLYRKRSIINQPIADIFGQVGKEVAELEKYQPTILKHPGLAKGNLPFLGRIDDWTSSLRYTGKK